MRSPLAFLAILLALSSWSPPAAAQETYLTAPESRIRIEGTSTLDSFLCETDEIVGAAELDEAVDQEQAGEPSAQLKADVDSFDCGKTRMNRDMQAALKAQEHPSIEFRLSDVQVLEINGADYMLRVSGRLIIAGTERDVALDVRGSTLENGRVRAHGAVDLLMTDFGIDPPSALFGLVRAHDQIKVTFDVYGTPDDFSVTARNGKPARN